MKFCTKCGNQLDDDMSFCPKCGCKSVPSSEENISETDPINASVSEKVSVNKTTRKGMKIAGIVCFVFAGLYAIMYLVEPTIISMTGFFGILGIMFLVLSKSPKEIPYILGKSSGLKKSIFVSSCLIVAFIFVGILGSVMGNSATSASDNEAPIQSTSSSANDDSTTSSSVEQEQTSQDSKSEDAVTLTDIQEWYDKQTPLVSQSLIEYAQSVNGISGFNIDDSKFLFGEDSGWYDCHYTFYFTCKIDGEVCSGEARAFLEYQSDDVKWFHFEIFRKSDMKSIVEHYDESYDQIIEDYYKDLTSSYN